MYLNNSEKDGGTFLKLGACSIEIKTNHFQSKNLGFQLLQVSEQVLFLSAISITPNERLAVHGMNTSGDASLLSKRPVLSFNSTLNTTPSIALRSSG